MRAVWYDRQGPAAEVLQVGELPDPEPGPGEVRVRVALSGISPGDTKKRRGWLGSSMPYPRVVPHSDASGVVDAVGPGVDPGRVGERVWVYNAQSYRASGTAAELTVVPERTAVALPPTVSDELGACLGIPGVTAHRAVFGDGSVRGKAVLVHGVLGAVGSLAAQLALRDGAQLVGTVRREADLAHVPARLRARTVALDTTDPVAAVRTLAPDGVDRVVEVAFSDNVDLDTAVLRLGGVLAAYATRADRPSFDFWSLLFANVTIRLLGSDDFPDEAKQQAAAELTEAAADGDLEVPVAPAFPLAETARAHDQVDADNRRRVLVAVSEEAGRRA